MTISTPSIAVFSAWTKHARDAKRVKLLPHLLYPDADWWLWFDWPFRLKVPPERLIEGFEDSQIVGFRHSMRPCAYVEHAACARMGKDDLGVMRKQMDRYDRERFPRNYGLLECGVLLRRNTPEVRAFNEAWWAEVEAGSIRDQLSVGYAAWRTGVKWDCWPGTVWENEFTERIECHAT